MAFANEQNYEQMIAAIQTFVRDVGEGCDAMGAAARDCVDNTQGDPAAARSAAKLNECVGRFREAADQAMAVAAALQRELEAIREAAAAASYD